MVFYQCKCRKVKGKGVKARRGRKRRGHKKKKCKYGHRKGSKRCRKHPKRRKR